MKDITYIFNATRLKNKTYKFYGTIQSDKDSGPYYTPHAIKNFGYKVRSTTRGSIWTSMHDVAHVVDLWDRAQTDRLLLEEFGWSLDKAFDGRHWPRNDLFKELRVLALQHFLCQNTFGWNRTKVNSAGNKRFLRGKSKIKGDFLPTKKEWDDRFEKHLRHYERVGYDTYIDMWQKACAFVKLYR